MRDLRLSIHILPEQGERRAGGSESVLKFLEPRCPADLPLEELWRRICTRHDRLYSARPPLNIKKLQDSQENDLEVKTLTVGDVFDDRDIVRVIQGPSRGSVAPESGLRPRFLARPLAGTKRPRQEHLSRPSSNLIQVQVIDEDEQESEPAHLSKRQRLEQSRPPHRPEVIDREIHPDTPVASRERDSEIGLAGTNWQEEQGPPSPEHIIEDSQRPLVNGSGTKSESPDDRTLLHSVPPSVPNSVRASPVVREAPADKKAKALQEALKARERFAARAESYSSPATARLSSVGRRPSNVTSGTPLRRSRRISANAATPATLSPSIVEAFGGARKAVPTKSTPVPAQKHTKNIQSPSDAQRRKSSLRSRATRSPRPSFAINAEGLRETSLPKNDHAIESEEEASEAESAPRSRMPTPNRNGATQKQKSPTVENVPSAPVANSVPPSPSPPSRKAVPRRSSSKVNMSNSPAPPSSSLPSAPVARLPSLLPRKSVPRRSSSKVSMSNSPAPPPSSRQSAPVARRSMTNEESARSVSSKGHSAEAPSPSPQPEISVTRRSATHDNVDDSPASSPKTSPYAHNASRSSRSPARFVSRTPSTDSDMDEPSPPRELPQTRHLDRSFPRESSQASHSPRARSVSSEETSEDEIPWKKPSPPSSPSNKPRSAPPAHSEDESSEDETPFKKRLPSSSPADNPRHKRAKTTSLSSQPQLSRSHPDSPSKTRPELPKYPSLSALKLHKPRYEPEDIAMGLWPSSQPAPSRFADSQTSAPSSQSGSRSQTQTNGIGVNSSKKGAEHHNDNNDEDEDEDDESSESSSSESESSGDSEDEAGQSNSQRLAGRQAGNEEAKKNKARSRFSDLIKIKASRRN